MMECYRSFSGANNNFQLPIYDQILTLMFFAASSRTFLRLSGRVKRPVIVRLLCHTFLRLSLKDTSRLEVTIKLQMAKFSSVCPEYAKCSFWKCLVQKLLPNICHHVIYFFSIFHKGLDNLAIFLFIISNVATSRSQQRFFVSYPQIRVSR